MAAEVVSAKSSELNIVVPGATEVWLERGDVAGCSLSPLIPFARCVRMMNTRSMQFLSSSFRSIIPRRVSGRLLRWRILPDVRCRGTGKTACHLTTNVHHDGKTFEIASSRYDLKVLPYIGLTPPLTWCDMLDGICLLPETDEFYRT